VRGAAGGRGNRDDGKPSALDALAQAEWSPDESHEYFADLARERLASRRLLVDALWTILKSLSLDADLPFVIEIK